MNAEQAIERVENWLLERPADPRGPYRAMGSLELPDGWCVSFTVVDRESGERIYENLSVDVHALGDLIERQNGIRTGRSPWQAVVDPECVLGEIEVPPNLRNTVCWTSAAESRPNPLHVNGPGPQATVFDTLIAWHRIGWCDLTFLVGLAVDLEVFVAGDDVFTTAPVDRPSERRLLRDVVDPRRELVVNPGGALSITLSGRAVARFLEDRY